MALIDYALIYDSDTNMLKYGKLNKVEQAISRLRMYEPEDGFFLAFSGGKDSVVLKRLADMAEIKYEAHYHITTLDPPELIRFIKQTHPDVIRDRPVMNAWDLMTKKLMPPTRLCRYCCSVLKEVHGSGRVTLTGVRWEESNSRKNHQGVAVLQHRYKEKSLIYNVDNHESRRMVEQCYRTRKVLVNPIVDWSNAETWEFIKAESIPYCGLYEEGWSRLGCIGCPLGGDNRYQEFVRWPSYKDKYIRTFQQIVDMRLSMGKGAYGNWSSGEAMFTWWMEEKEDQPYDLGLFEGMEIA